MKYCSLLSFVPASVVSLAVGLSECKAQAGAAQCAPAPPSGEVIFEVRIRYYDADVFTPSGYNFVDYGPALGNLSAPARIDGTLNPRRQETLVSVSELASGALTFDLYNTAEVQAQRPDGHSFGNGGRLIVDAFVRGHTGTPYFATRLAEGIVEANFPQGLGRADASFNSQTAGSVNGAGAMTTPVQLATISTGLSGFERDFGGVTYSHAGQYGYDVNGIIFQSIDFCFPFSPCPLLHYWARGRVTGSMEVGIGHPPCSGTIEQGWCTPCFGAFTRVGRQYAINVDITPVGASGSCDCCEYRQYNRNASVVTNIPFMAYTYARGIPNPPNAAGERRDCDSWAEDNGFLPNGLRMVGYGHRTPLPNGDVTLGAYTDMPRTLQDTCMSNPNVVPDGCHYESRDDPTFPDNLGGIRRYIEFEGRVISKAACTPGATHDVVLARKRWTLCCETTALGMVSSCAEGGPPDLPPLVFTHSAAVGQHDVRLLFIQDGVHMVVFAIVGTDPLAPLGPGAVSIDVPGVTAESSSAGPLEMTSYEGAASQTYFPFLLSAPVSGTVPVTVDVLGAQALWQVDLSELGGYCSPAPPNSTGQPGRIRTAGSRHIAANNFALVAEQLPQSSFGFFLTSRAQGFVAGPGGSQGNLCLGGAIGRFVGPGQVLNSGAAGSFTLPVNLSVVPTPTGLVPAQPGETWNFQAWFRDANPGVTSNLTDAVSVTFD